MRSDPPEVQNKFEQIINKTASQSQLYEDNTAKKIILTENQWLEKYPYATTKLKGKVNPIVYGFTDAYFGGNIDSCAIVKGEPYILLVDADLKTIGIYIPNEDLDKLKLQELRDLCDKYKKKYKVDDTKARLIELLTK
jgi:hypothetical protein